MILGDLHRAQTISDDFPMELKRIRTKYINVGYPIKFIESVIRSFTSKYDEEVLIPHWLFEEKKNKVLIRLPFSHQTEGAIYKFIKNLEQFTNDNCKFIIIWNTREIKTLLKIKSPTSPA